MSIGKYMEKIASLVLCGLSLAVIVIAKNMPVHGKWETGPGMFPMVIGVSLLAFSLALFIKKPAGKSEEGKHEEGVEDDQVGPSARNLFFFLGATKRATKTGALIGMTAGLIAVGVVAFTTKTAWPWYTVVGSLVTFIVGSLVSSVAHVGEREDAV